MSCPGDPGRLTYANLTGRPPGRLMSTAARLLAGPATVEAQIRPYAAAWHAANLRTLARTRPRWTVLGDSMSTGIGASGPFEGWVGQAHRLLDGLGVDVLNLAAYGARTEDVADQQLPAWREVGAAPAGEVVSLFVGANDLMVRRWRDALPGSFAALLAQLPAGSVVATMPQPRRASQAVNAEIARLAATGRIRTVEMRSAGPASWRGKLAGDHFHPNDLGYAGIAAAFAPVLRAAFEAQRTGEEARP